MSIVDELNAGWNSLARNNSMRIMITLCVDTSLSMKIRIGAINDGIRGFLNRIASNNTAKYATELSVITFDAETKDIIRFGSVDDAIRVIQMNDGIRAQGYDTRMGSAVLHALNQLDRRIEEFNAMGVQYYKPWLILISDGNATDTETVKKASASVQERLRKNQLRTMCLSMGDGSENLKDFTLDGRVARLEDLKVLEFFEMLSRSVSQYSRSSLPSVRTAMDDYNG